ncbi:MAG TPA: glycosyltransferase [Candidatus Bathyarchaeia archaeon]|nr:glycosyltransferase [Candidatus Bathyarchaeia archaeon]
MKPKPRSLLIITEDSPESFSPAGERVHHLALAGKSEFSKVAVLALRPSQKPKGRHAKGSISESGVTLHTVNFSRALPYPFVSFYDPVKMIMLLSHGLRIARRFKPSHILASMPPLETGTSAWLLAKLLGVKLLVDLRDDWESSVSSQLKRYFPTSLTRSLSLVAKEVYTSASAILTVTQTIKDTLQSRLVQTPLLLLPNGADTRIFHPISKEARHKVRIEYSLPLDKLVIAYCGSGLTPYYRLDRLLTSMTLLSKNALDSLFFVFYVYNGHAQLDSLKHQLKIQEGVVDIRSPLPRSQLAKALAACDVGLVPFDSKPYLLCARSTKLYEYSSSGLYVICSGPRGGELDTFFSSNPELGLFTLPDASNFAQVFGLVSEKAENLLEDSSRQSRYGFIRQNYDRQTLMRKSFRELFETVEKARRHQ